MAAGNYDIVIDQGSDFSIELVVAQNGNPVNLGSHSASAQLRPPPTSTTLSATYDLELFNTSANSITRLIQGVARVTAEVTR